MCPKHQSSYWVTAFHILSLPATLTAGLGKDDEAAAPSAGLNVMSVRRHGIQCFDDHCRGL